MSKLRHYRSIDQPTSANIRKKTMTAICFVCNLPIMSHQVGLVWQGGNGWDDLVREQLEESTIRQRLGGRRDSAAQINTPPSTSPPPGLQRRRRSSLAQLTDILREWSGGGAKQQARTQKAPLNRRETLADLARSLPWRTSTTDAGTNSGTTYIAPRKRRESSADSGIRSMRSRRDSNTAEFVKHWNRRESTVEEPTVVVPVVVESSQKSNSRRGSGESYLSGSRRDSNYGHATTPPPPPKIIGVHPPPSAPQFKKRDSLAAPEFPIFRQEQRPSTSSGGSDSVPLISTTNYNQVDSACQALPPPTIIMSSVTPPATSPTAPKGRRDSTTQCGRVNRRDSKAGISPERAPRLQRLQRQATAVDDSCFPGGSRRGSQPALSPDPPEEGQQRTSRRDSLSPDSASRGRRDSRAHLSPDRSHDRDGSPRRTLRRQSSSAARSSRSPDSNSCCSSRDPSPCSRPPPLPVAEPSSRPAIRRQSTTEEILIARGFRRQSTTEEMIRCRNFRRQSSQSDDVCRYRGRRDSSAQIIDGTIGTMTVETTSTFFDSSTQTEQPQTKNKSSVNMIKTNSLTELYNKDEWFEDSARRQRSSSRYTSMYTVKSFKSTVSVRPYAKLKELPYESDFFDRLCNIPDIDEISLDESLKRELDIETEISTLTDEGEEEQSDIESQTRLEENHENVISVELIPVIEEEDSASSFSLAEFSEHGFISNETEDKSQMKTARDPIFPLLIESDSKQSSGLDPFEFAERLNKQIESKVKEDVPVFLNQLINDSINRAEYVDPIEITRTKLDKKKLFYKLYNLLQEYFIDCKVNDFLEQKCISLYKGQRVFRPIMPDSLRIVNEEKAKYNIVVNKLNQLIDKEYKTTEIINKRLSELQKQTKSAKNELEYEITLLENFIRKTFKERGTSQFMNFIEENLKEMATLRQNITEVRCMQIQKLNTLATLEQKSTELENIENDLKLKDFMHLRHEVHALESKLKERTDNLERVHARCNANIQVLAHIREKHYIIIPSMCLQKDLLQDAEYDRDFLLNYINRLKIDHIRVKKELREQSFKNGLIDKPHLLLDYDQTMEKIENVKIKIIEMKTELARLEKRIDRIQKVCK